VVAVVDNLVGAANGARRKFQAFRKVSITALLWQKVECYIFSKNYFSQILTS